MKIRSVLELSEFLDNDLVWRKRELTSLKLLIPSLRRHEQDVTLRSGLCILYAHWEGYIKNGALAYTDFVTRKKLKYTELSINFIGLALRKSLKEIGQSNKAKDHQEIVKLFLNDFTREANFSPDDSINTQSNLTFTVFENILDALGLDFPKYATKSMMIDNQLVLRRHGIAHGERVMINLPEYEQLHDEVIALMNSFKTDIENAVYLKNYLY